MARARPALLLLCANTSTAVAETPDLDLAARLSTEYTSNLFHEQNRRLDDFAVRTGDGERFDGMKGPWDIVTTPAVESALSFDLAEKRKARLELGFSYPVHARNSIANYLTVEMGAGYDWTQRDETAVAVELVPRRFKKNYAHGDGSGGRIYERADYFEADAELSYRRNWSKRVRSDFSLGFRARRFDDPFANRDENEYRGVPSLRVRAFKKLWLEGGVEVAYTATPAGLELGVAADRSRVDIEPNLSLLLDLPHRFEVEAGLAVRFRRYLTDVETNDSYFHRHDRRLSFESAVSKRFGHGWTAFLQSTFTDNDADRTTPEDNDEFDYREVTVGGGIEYAFL